LPYPDALLKQLRLRHSSGTSLKVHHLRKKGKYSMIIKYHLHLYCKNYIILCL